MYPVRKTRKMPANKGHKWPAIFLTPQNYSEIARSATRTDNLGGRPSLIEVSTSQLMDMSSLFPNIFSLITNLDYPVNFPVSREFAPISGENQFVAYLNTTN